MHKITPSDSLRRGVGGAQEGAARSADAYRRSCVRATAVVLSMLSAFAFLLIAGQSGAGAQDDEDVRLNLLHGIPGLAVDVVTDLGPLVEDFEFGDMLPLSSQAGETLQGLEVLISESDQVAIAAGDVPLPEAGSFSIVAHLDEVGQPTLAVFPNVTTEIDPGQGRLTVRHVAAASPVDIFLDGTLIESGMENGEEITADLDAGTYEVVVEADGEIVIGPDDIVVREGMSHIVYAVGSANDQLRTLNDDYEVTENAPVTPTPTPVSTDDDDDSSSGSGSSGSGTSGSGSGVTTMTESVSGLGSSPGGVNTGLTAVTVIEFSLSRTLLAVAFALLAVTGVVAGVRRRNASHA